MLQKWRSLGQESIPSPPRWRADAQRVTLYVEVGFQKVNLNQKNIYFAGRPGAPIPGSGTQSGGRPLGRPGIDINTSSRPGN